MSTVLSSSDAHSTHSNRASDSETRCGFVAIVGRPNVGKSTLFNRLMETHLSPVTHKPQTTRSNIRGILTAVHSQMILVDTPGLHHKIHRPLNRVLNNNVYHALNEVDVVLMMVARDVWLKEDARVLERVQAAHKPCVLIVNKVDLTDDKSRLLPTLERLQARYDFYGIFPLSALKDPDFDALKRTVADLLPSREFIFDPDQLSDQSEYFLVAELIREQAMRELHQELPYMVHLQIDQFHQYEKLTHIHATLYVEKEQQRPIVIGDKGEKIKRIGTRARKHIESLLGKRVYLRLWVKVNKSLGQRDESLLGMYGDR